MNSRERLLSLSEHAPLCQYQLNDSIRNLKHFTVLYVQYCEKKKKVDETFRASIISAVQYGGEKNKGDNGTTALLWSGVVTP
jgi:hypothetical protein